MRAQAWAKWDNLHEPYRPITGLEVYDTHTHTHRPIVEVPQFDFILDLVAIESDVILELAIQKGIS